MSRLILLNKSCYKLVPRKIFIETLRTSNISYHGKALRKFSTNTSYVQHAVEKDEHEINTKAMNYDLALDIYKKQNIEDFVKIVDKFQKANLADLQRMLLLAQRLQASHQISNDHQRVILEVEELNKIHLGRIDQMDQPDVLESSPSFQEKQSSETFDLSQQLTQLENVISNDVEVKSIHTGKIRGNTSFGKEDVDNMEVNLTNVKKIVSNIKWQSQKDLTKSVLDSKKLMKRTLLLENVKCYLELCITTGMLNRGFTFLTNLYMREKSKPPEYDKSIKNIGLYVDLMNAWAKIGNYEAMRKLYTQIIDLRMKPTHGVFAAIFECLGRADKTNTNAIKHFISEVQKHGLKLEDVLSSRVYTPMEHKYVVKALSPLLPHLVLKSKTFDHDYNCPLLNHLNDSPTIVNPSANLLSAEDVNSRLKRLIMMEVQDEVTIKSIVPEPKDINFQIQEARRQLDTHREEWRKSLLESFNTTIGILEQSSVQMVCGVSLYPFLKLWQPEVYVELMIQEIEHICRDLTGYCPPTHNLHHILGHKVFNKFMIQSRFKRLERLKSVYKQYLEKIQEKNLSANHRRLWNDISLEKSLRPVMLQNWSYERKKEIGKLMYDMIMCCVKVQKPDSKKINSNNAYDAWNVMAFYTRRTIREDVHVEEVVPHPLLKKLYAEAELTEMKFSPVDLPMLLPPVPWVAHNTGGCLLNSVDLIRHPGFNRDQLEHIKDLPEEKLYPVFDGLNVLGACPWKVKTWILDHIINLFLSGGDKKLDVPAKFSGLQKIQITDKMTSEEIHMAKKHNKEVVKQDHEHYSIWVSELYRLSIANAFRKDIFWLSHTLDFRGRAYPTQPHFNHFGSDLARSLLEFGVGKPLGPDGLIWLKIHLINLTGFKKRNSNEEKLAFANEIMDLIEDSVDNPFDGKKWWQTSDKPWETLSCCKEIIDALRSPDPEKFVSHLPVHQDGSCNGLQHYAALGRDTKGARSVSLAPSSHPQDVYSDVVEIIEKERLKDAAKGVEIAKQLEGFVTRKVVKQSIMTSVYGVTKYGARKQIGGQLRDIEDFPPELVFDAKSYLTEKTFNSLKLLFNAADQIQDWFVTCAHLITECRKQKVSWVTPMGWPVIQPYVKVKKLEDDQSYRVPAVSKQKNAFPPNFIHSLDSTHMLLTAIHCYRSGVMFASVHDCFWSHASDISELNKICREQFVALHKEPILENLSNHFLENFSFKESEISDKQDESVRRAKLLVGEVFRKVPQKGNFNIEEVKDSTYFFS